MNREKVRWCWDCAAVHVVPEDFAVRNAAAEGAPANRDAGASPNEDSTA